uniref:RRM domain-containing protein n=2 Tax=Ditylenchus dipsaci TaxID=166011 RepID=A0A915EAD7_9BILA
MGRGESPDRRARSPSYSRRTYSRSPKREVHDYDSPPRRSRMVVVVVDMIEEGRSPRRSGRDNLPIKTPPEADTMTAVSAQNLAPAWKIFSQYGDIESVQIVYDRFSGRSRGFGFVYFTSTRNASKAKDHMQEAVIDGMKVRVDYSVTRGGGPYRHQQNSALAPAAPNEFARVPAVVLALKQVQQTVHIPTGKNPHFHNSTLLL